MLRMDQSDCFEFVPAKLSLPLCVKRTSFSDMPDWSITSYITLRWMLWSLVWPPHLVHLFFYSYDFAILWFIHTYFWLEPRLYTFFFESLSCFLSAKLSWSFRGALSKSRLFFFCSILLVIFRKSSYWPFLVSSRSLFILHFFFVFPAHYFLVPPTIELCLLFWRSFSNVVPQWFW